MRVPRCELRDHINCRKNDRWPSYRFYRALQRLKSSIRCICEIFGAARFSSFSTQSANRRLTQRSNYQLFARVRSVVNAQKESGSLSRRPKTGSGKTRDWKSIQEKPVEDTTARLSF